MKSLSILMETHGHYNFMDMCVAQGLKHLGHMVYGAHGSEQNFCTPHSGEAYDLFIQCVDEAKTVVPEGIPSIFVWGDDSGKDAVPTHYPDFDAITTDLVFVRDYRGGGPDNVFPMNFGIEDRFYCAHGDSKPKPLHERRFDVTFLGRWDAYKGRLDLFNKIKAALGSKLKLNIQQMIYRHNDQYWAKWINVHCFHDPRYYTALAESRIVLSPLGAGPDCARHWEALASGGIPLIQEMPTVQVPPKLQDGVDCLLFSAAEEAIEKIQEALLMKNADASQELADNAFAAGKEFHTTQERAQYILNTCEMQGLLQ